MEYQIFINNQDLGRVSEDILQSAEIISLEEDKISLRHKNLNYEVICEAIDLEEKVLSLKINGVIHEVSILNDVDRIVQSLGLEANLTVESSDVLAPMPGKVLEVKVKPGDKVTEGDALLILEAMKMENILKATGEGVISSIEIEVGQTVEKGTLLVTME